jgi:insertion element IS1 protein InsB
MIEETITYSCRSCDSTDIIRNGRNKCGNEQYHCKSCGCYRVLRPQKRYTEERKAEILQGCRERMSLRGVQRVFGVCRKTVLRWIEQRVAELSSVSQTVLPASEQDVLELDEVVTFVSEKFFKRWLWTALCRRTRQIVAYAIGDRSETTARLVWQAIPEPYRICPVYTDDYNVYPLIVPAAQHHPAAKAAHQTNHQERWNNTLRQWLGRYTRKTLSFSKSDHYHELITHWFILEYNLAIHASLTL